MQFMLIFFQDEDPPSGGLMGEMGKFGGELARAGKMRGGGNLVLVGRGLEVEERLDVSTHESPSRKRWS